MSAAILGVLAGLFSATLFWLLAVRDPKRLRAWRARMGGARRTPATRRQRRAWSALALLPGAVLALAGLWPAWLIWLGASFSLGWLATLWLSRATAARLDAGPPGPRRKHSV